MAALSASARRSRPTDWPFLTDSSAPARGPNCRADRDDQGRGPWPRRDRRTCPSTGPGPTLGTTSAPTFGRHPRAGHRRRASLRPSADGPTLTRSPGARWAPTTRSSWCKDFQGGRSFYTARHVVAELRRREAPALWSARSAGRPAGRPDLQRLRCDRPVELPAGQARAPPNVASPSASTSSRTGGSSRPIAAPARSTCTTRRRARSRAESPRIPGLHEQRGRPLRPGRRQQLRDEPLGLPLLLAADRLQDVKQSDGSIDAEHHDADRGDAALLEHDSRRHDKGTSGSGSSSSRASSSSTREPDPTPIDLSSERRILRVSNNRGACCHVAGDIELRQVQQPLVRRPATTRPPARQLEAASGPFNDMKTDEAQTVRVNNATGGTFTLTFKGQTTSPLAFNSTAAADRRPRCRRSARVGAGNAVRRPAGPSTRRTSP